MRDNLKNSLRSQYTGFTSCLETAEYEEMLQARRIHIKDKRKKVDVILKPNDYIKYIESIRGQIKK